MIKTINVTIKGISPLLMHKFPLIPPEAVEKRTKEEQAEIFEYRDEQTNELYIPALAMQRAFVSAASFSKGKGRLTLQKPVAACVFIEPQHILLGVKTYEIDI